MCAHLTMLNVRSTRDGKSVQHTKKVNRKKRPITPLIVNKPFLTFFRLFRPYRQFGFKFGFVLLDQIVKLMCTPITDNVTINEVWSDFVMAKIAFLVS